MAAPMPHDLTPPAHGPVILQVLPALQAGGVERGTIEVARAIVRAGGTALVASAGGRMVPQLERVGATHLTLDLMTKDPLSIWLNAGRLVRLIRTHQVDLVHARSRAPAWSARWATRRTGTPFVTTWHGVYSETLPFKRRYNGVMASGARVVAISRYVADRIARDYGVGPDRLRTIPRGADAASFDPDAVRGDRVHALARRWALPDGSAVIMLPGRITGWKGQALLLAALARLDALSPELDWVCVLVGAAREGSAALRNLLADADRLGLRSRLRFAGQCDDMPAALAMADLVVIPSLKPEPFGRTAVEAQAMRRVVLAAGHGAMLETVQDGVTGYLFPPGDAEALAALMQRALSLTPEQRDWLGGNARAAMLAHFTSEAMQQATLDVYDELLEHRFHRLGAAAAAGVEPA